MSLYNKQQKLYSRQGVNDSFIPKELYIKRDSWFQEITDYEGIVILTGTSDIGKTYLLDQLMTYFDQNSICYYFEDSSYFRKLDQEQMDDKEYIILDQFERALSFDNIDENISVLKNLSDKKIIISIRNEFFGNIYKALDFNKSINIVWLDYSKNEIEECEYPDAAYVILYLLCLDHKGQYTNTMKDFQNISIMMEEEISDVMNFLYEQKWVKKLKKNPDIMRSWTEPCEIAHDYLQEQFEEICIEQIPSSVRSNIDYYNKNCQIQRESNEQITSWRTYTNKVCNKFLEKK